MQPKKAKIFTLQNIANIQDVHIQLIGTKWIAYTDDKSNVELSTDTYFFVGTDLYTLVDNQLVPVTEVIDGEQVNITTVDYETRGEDKEFLDKLKNCKIYADVKDRIKIATDF